MTCLIRSCKTFLTCHSKSSSLTNFMPQVFGSMWRYQDYANPHAVWPNYKPHITHHKHRRRMVKPFSEGVFKQTKVRVVDNSKIGMEAMSLGRPPKVIQVYTKRHLRGPNGPYGILGDKVKVAIMGEMRLGIIVGMKCKQPHGIPVYDTNNIVLISEDGSPLGTSITVPIPYVLKDILTRKTVFKKADYTKMLRIATNGFI